MNNSKMFKLEIFAPETHFRMIQDSLQAAGAGRIGCYDCCLAYSHVTGAWRPLEGSSPFIGKTGERCEEPEVKIEVNVTDDRLEETIKAIRAVHPYEEPLINVIPLIYTK